MTLENYEYIRDLAAKQIRLSGRSPGQRRPIEIKNKVINHSDGSARVKIGKTDVIAGVKVLPGEPFKDRPNEGGLIVNFEASELASKYASDRITYSVEVGRVTDRGIRESNIIDLSNLIIEPAKKAGFVYIDIVAVNNDGNLMDAANIAAISALLDAKFKIENMEDYKEVPLDKTKLPISHTFVKIGDTIFFDPDADEENVADCRLTIAVGEKINSIQKGGSGFFTPEEVDFCADAAFKLREEVNEMLMKQIKS
ncbi:MAG: RNA-binding protein [Candidatus Parvarchaeota archaeon]|jgi:exosome complex component RRP42|nr:RNA-binding protein [Candidatus Parvarchaeota archaeon]MCL5017942.1 RNA-binding protein [Candidatus Parvarchaeota archaeon]